jgi:hypothetical protein
MDVCLLSLVSHYFGELRRNAVGKGMRIYGDGIPDEGDVVGVAALRFRIFGTCRSDAR